MPKFDSRRDKLMQELELAKASYDSAEVERLGKALEKLKEETDMKKEDLKDILETPGNTEKNMEIIINKTKERVKKSIQRYITKAKEWKQLKNADIAEKEKLQKELETAKKEAKEAKDSYESAKEYFMGKMEYQPEELSRISTRWIRFGKKTSEGGVTKFAPMEKLSFSSLKRRIFINKLIKKCNKIGKNTTAGARFVMGFTSARFLRYTSIKGYNEVQAIGKRMGMMMNPKKFHQKFIKGRDNIFAILDKGEKTKEEQTMIDTLKKRINYYGHAYARQRANERIDPFLTEEKNKPEDQRIVQKTA